jgi:NRPS condensation-like uncharacterized protein
MKAHASPGNIGRIILEVEEAHTLEVIKEKLASTLAKSIYRLRYVYRWLKEGSYWEEEQHEVTCQVEIQDASKDEFLDELPIPEFGVTQSRLYKVFWIEQQNRYFMMLSWHHLLFDARGAEVFAKYLIDNIATIEKEDCFPSYEAISVKDAMLGARDFKAYLMREKGLPIDTLITKAKVNDPVIKYKKINFDIEETEAVHKRAASMIRLMKSPFYLACCGMVVRSIMEKRKINFTSLLMPVPQDQRKRGSIKPLVGNNISYLFFRLKKDDFDSLEAVVKNLSAQMMEQVKIKLPAKYAGMMHVFKRTPLSFYNFLTKGPTKGKFASFFFSDTGITTAGVPQEGSTQIIDMIHLPPPNTFPGLTIVFSQFAKRLKISVCHTDDTLSNEEFHYFEEEIKRLLIGKA